MPRAAPYGDLISVDLIADEKDVDGAFYYRKRHDYSNEEEVRLISRRTAGAMHDFDPELLTRLILGKDMALENRALVLEWAARRSPPLPIVEARYDFRQHRLVLEDAAPLAAK